MSKESDNKWQALFAEQERSGLTVVAFCKERNINPQTFYTQRYKHKKRSVSDDVAEKSDFIAVNQVVSASDTAQTITVQCGEVSILIPSGFDIYQLTTLVKELR